MTTVLNDCDYPAEHSPHHSRLLVRLAPALGDHHDGSLAKVIAPYILQQLHRLPHLLAALLGNHRCQFVEHREGSMDFLFLSHFSFIINVSVVMHLTARVLELRFGALTNKKHPEILNIFVSEIWVQK